MRSTTALLLALAGCGGSSTRPTMDLSTVFDATPADAARAAPMMLTVEAATNPLTIDACQVTPAAIRDLPAGAYEITLAASTLSKGNVTMDPPVASTDDYVLIEASGSFLMLNGVGAHGAFTLAAPGTVRAMFVDSDGDSNSGEATVTVTPGAYETTVSAAENVLRWGPEGCSSTPASLQVTPSRHEVKLVESTLPAGASVLVRIPSIVADDDHRYVLLSGMGASWTFDRTEDTSLRAWVLGADGSGAATLAISDR